MTGIIKIIEKALKLRKLTATKASKLATGKDGLIKNIKAGHSPSFENIEKLFAVLGVNLTYSFEDTMEPAIGHVPLLGYISAGGDDLPDDTSVSFFPDNESNEQTNMPPGAYLQRRGNIFSLQVKGSSMRPIYSDGDILFMYKDDPARGDLKKLIGTSCAVTLEDGEVYVKTLRRPDSGKLGEWNLESLNPVWPMMTNQRLLEALPVRHVTHPV